MLEGRAILFGERWHRLLPGWEQRRHGHRENPGDPWPRAAATAQHTPNSKTGIVLVVLGLLECATHTRTPHTHTPYMQHTCSTDTPSHTHRTHIHTLHIQHTRGTHTRTQAPHTRHTRVHTRHTRVQHTHAHSRCSVFFSRVSLYVLRLNPSSPSDAPRAGKPEGKAGRFALRKSLRLAHAIRLSRETFTARCPADQKARPLGAGGRSTRACAARRGAIRNQEGRRALCFSQTGQPHVPYLLDACAACSFSEVA